MQAGGVALAHFVSDSLLGFTSGIAAIIIGGALAVVGYRRYRAADRAIRNGGLPSVGKGPAFEVVLIVLIAVFLALAQIGDLIR